MHGEMSTAQSMIQTSINRDPIPMVGKRLQQRRFLIGFPHRLRKELIALKT
jgi:hypothetical protein